MDVLKEEIEYTCLQQVEQSQEMAHDIAHYHRVHDSHPHKSYAYLYDTLNRHLALKQQERNRQEQVNMRNNLAKHGSQMAAPAGGQEPKKPKPKKRAKAKADSPTLDQIKKAFAEAMPAQQSRNSWGDGKGTKGTRERQGERQR